MPRQNNRLRTTRRRLRNDPQQNNFARPPAGTLRMAPRPPPLRLSPARRLRNGPRTNDRLPMPNPPHPRNRPFSPPNGEIATLARIPFRHPPILHYHPERSEGSRASS